MDFVKVKGKEFYYKGEPILFSGLGVGFLAEYGAFHARASRNGCSDKKDF